MRHSRRALLARCLFAVLLVVAARAAWAGECPISGTGYAAPYQSSAKLPRCAGTITKWSPCEVCMIGSNDYFDEKDPYLESYYPPAGKTAVQPHTTFTSSQPGVAPVEVDGFFDGLTNGTKAVFRVRFTPAANSGTVSFTTQSPDAGLRVGGSFNAADRLAADQGFLRRDPDYARTFKWDDGTHVFLWGQTFYQIVNHARLDDKNIFQKPITQSGTTYHFNKVRLAVSPWGGDPRYGTSADSRAFQRDTPTGPLIRDKLDILNWRALDEVTSFLRTSKMVADLILFHDGGPNGSPYGTTLQNQRYTRYVLARYAAFPNVTWTLANEYQNVTGSSPGSNNDPWDDLGCLIRGCDTHPTAADPWFANGTALRPLSIHNNINKDSNKGPTNGSYPCFEFFLSKWPSDVVLQTRRPATTIVDAEAGGAVLKNSIPGYQNPDCLGLSTSPRLPVVNDEYYYVGQTTAASDQERHRNASWAVATSGGFGSTGDLLGVIDDRCKHGPNDDTHCSPTLFTTWFDEPGYYSDIKNLIDYFALPDNGLDKVWWQMNPIPSKLTNVESTRAYGMEGGNQFVVYLAKGGSSGPKPKFKLQAPAGKYSVIWKDPQTAAKGQPIETVDKRITSDGAAFPTQFATMKKHSGWADWIVRVVPKGTPLKTAAAPDETVWVWDDVPGGAITGGDSESWTWVDDEPAAISDSLAHTSNLVAGMHQHYFYGASETLPIAAGDWLYAYVYLESASMPSEVMLQWNDGTWEHRAYWGSNQLGWGTNGTNSRRYMGPLPLPDRWVRLEVPASAVGLEGHTLNGMAFTLYDGKGSWDEAGRASASMPQCDESAITLQPQSQTIIPGVSATLSVAVSGTGPFNYQFYQAPVGVYQNPTGISTATITTGPIYTTKQYWAEINDTCQGTFLHSDAAVITVQCSAAPTITQQPTSRVTTPGQSTTLSVSATQGVSYQWYQGSTPISGAINPTLTVAPQSTTSYWVRVTNGCGTADSMTATVCVLPAITAQPTPRTINPGQSTTLTVSAVNAVTYQWYVGSASSTATPIGTNSSSLVVTPSATTNYWVRISNSCGSVDSTTVTVTVAPVPPAQITRIQSVSVLANSQQSITARWNQPTQAGTFLVAVISGLKDPAALSWTAPAGWQLAVVEEWPNVKLAIYYLANNAGARTSETFTVQQGYHDMTLYVAEYSGVMAVNPLDRTASTGDFTNNGYVQTGYTANTVQPKELVITGLSTYTQTEFTVSPTEGFTELYDQYMLYHLTTAMYERITTASGSYGHSANVYVPAEWVGVVATFKAANTN